jgi:hypothetical protein
MVKKSDKVNDIKEWVKNNSSLNERNTIRVKPLFGNNFRVDIWEQCHSGVVMGSRIASSYFIEYADEIKDMTV